MDRVQKHKDICNELNDVYASKNSDYGNSFGDTFDKLGIISAITRISDKYNRLVSLCTKSEEERKVKDESITDTLLDMANYCIMTVIEMHKNDNKIPDFGSLIDRYQQEHCDHEWKPNGIRYDNETYEIQRCDKCGTTREVRCIGL